MTRKNLLANLMIITTIIILSLVVFLITRCDKSPSKAAQIWYENTLITTIDLVNVTDTKTEEIKLNDELTIKIEYQKGAIRVIDAPCHTKECVHSGWTTSVNKPLICLDLHYKIILIDKDKQVDISL